MHGSVPVSYTHLDVYKRQGKDFLSYYHYHKFDKKYGYCFESSNGFQGLIYNKTVFEKEGITELPKTLDEFYTICD